MPIFIGSRDRKERSAKEKSCVICWWCSTTISSSSQIRRVNFPTQGTSKLIGTVGSAVLSSKAQTKFGEPSGGFAPIPIEFFLIECVPSPSPSPYLQRTRPVSIASSWLTTPRYVLDRNWGEAAA